METRIGIHGRNEEEAETMGKNDRKGNKRGCSKRGGRRVERVARLRREEFAQLRGEHITAHRRAIEQETSLLSPMACPSCGFQWGSPNVLQRSSPKRSDRKVSRSLDCQGVELRSNEQNKGKSSTR